MKHIIDGKQVDIDWEKVELIEYYGSGESDWRVSGYDFKSDKEYFGDANYQDDELIEVTGIEVVES